MQLLSAIFELPKVSKGVKTHETFPPQWGNNCKRNKTLYNNVNDSERIELRYSKSAIFELLIVSKGVKTHETFPT